MPVGLFIFFAVVAIVSSLGVVAQRNPVHCLLALILTLVAIGGLFVALGAVAVGFLQIIVYVGAIMVLFLFVICS
jgi:NADH-quinone oxidoreductase subunit J